MFEMHGNPYWILVLVYNVGGAGEVIDVKIKGSIKNDAKTENHLPLITCNIKWNQLVPPPPPLSPIFFCYLFSLQF